MSFFIQSKDQKRNTKIRRKEMQNQRKTWGNSCLENGGDLVENSCMEIRTNILKVVRCWESFLKAGAAIDATCAERVETVLTEIIAVFGLIH